MPAGHDAVLGRVFVARRVDEDMIAVLDNARIGCGCKPPILMKTHIAQPGLFGFIEDGYLAGA